MLLKCSACGAQKQVAAAAELVALRGAAAAAADDAARLAAQVQHLQAEVTAKKVTP